MDKQVVLVTGATSGIGQATALLLADAGAAIICAARREDRGAAIVRTIRDAGGWADFVRTDIGEPESIVRLFDFITDRYGRLDAAVNNAGIEVPQAPLPDQPLAHFEETMSVNARGTFLCLQHEMRLMRQQRTGGAIVNIASIGGILGLKASSAYVASKHAIVGLTRAAAMDGAEHAIRVNAICPSATRTEMMERWTGGDEAIARRMGKLVPLGRVADVAEVARTVAWLLSPASSYVTAAIIPVDGGLSGGVQV